MTRSPAGFTLIELMLTASIISILAGIAIPNYIAMQARAKEAEVLGLAHAVQLTAEDHAARNEGQYSDLAADLVPLLPGAALLRNAFTGQRSEPQFSADAVTPGQIGTRLIVRDGVATGYVITGFGKNEEILRYWAGS